jgi:cis-3-alkyl-4-acyloxetan-2-one decarboxylase
MLSACTYSALMNSATKDWKPLYPSAASQSWKIGRLRYHYLDSAMLDASNGSSREKPVILCVHGNPTWSFYYREVVRQCSDTHRVIAVDHIGCGLSDKPPRDQYAYTLASRRDDLLSLIDHLGLRQITLLAHDWGGAIGLAAAVERASLMAGIILLNTAAFPPPYMPKRIGILRTPLLGSIAIRQFNAFAGPAVSMAMSKNKLREEVAAGLLHPYQTWRDRVAVDSFVKDIPMSKSHPTYAVLEKLEKDLSRLAHLPKRLIWGMKDWCFRPECLERFLRHWPDAEVVRLDDVGHYVIEDDPDRTLAAIKSFIGREQSR